MSNQTLDAVSALIAAQAIQVRSPAQVCERESGGERVCVEEGECVYVCVREKE